MRERAGRCATGLWRDPKEQHPKPSLVVWLAISCRVSIGESIESHATAMHTAGPENPLRQAICASIRPRGATKSLGVRWAHCSRIPLRWTVAQFYSFYYQLQI